MLVRHVALQLSRDEFDRVLGSNFLFRSCYLTNFLARRVRELRIRSDQFNGIFVEGRREAADPARIDSDRGLLVPVHFDESLYQALGPGDEHEFFIAMILAGLEKAAPQHKIPLAELRLAIAEFRRGGYRNEWTHQKKVLRAVGLHASLICRLDPEKFTLTLKLERKGTIVFEREILETKPDEVIFAHRFKDVVAADDSIVVRDEFGKTTFAVQISSLA